MSNFLREQGAWPAGIDYGPGKRRKFLYKGIWCMVGRQSNADGLWIVYYNRAETKEQYAIGSKFLEVSRHEAIKRLRVVIAESLNPNIRKVTRSLSKSKQTISFDYETAEQAVKNYFENYSNLGVKKK